MCCLLILQLWSNWPARQTSALLANGDDVDGCVSYQANVFISWAFYLPEHSLLSTAVSVHFSSLPWKQLTSRSSGGTSQIDPYYGGRADWERLKAHMTWYSQLLVVIWPGSNQWECPGSRAQTVSQSAPAPAPPWTGWHNIRFANSDLLMLSWTDLSWAASKMQNILSRWKSH